MRTILRGLLAVLVLLLATPVWAQPPLGYGWLREASATFNTADASAVIAMDGRNAAFVSVAAGTLTGTLVATASLDGGTTYTSGGSAVTVMFVDPVTGAAATTLALVNPNAAVSRGLLIPTGATHIKLTLSAYTSGSAAVTVRADLAHPATVLYGTDGTNLRAVTVDSAYGLPVTLMTVASIQGYNRTASGALGALNNAVTIDATGSGGIAWEIDTGTLSGTVVGECTLDDSNWFGPLALLQTDGHTKTHITTFGVRGHFKRVGWSQCRLRVSAYTSGTSNARLAVSPGPTGIDPEKVSCLGNYAITTAGAATATAVAGVASENIYVCGWYVISAGTTNVNLVYGDDANCSTNKTALDGALPLTAQAGVSSSRLIQVPAGKFLCVQNSQAIQISGGISYEQF